MKDSGRCLNFTSEIMFRQFVNFLKKLKYSYLTANNIQLFPSTSVDNIFPAVSAETSIPGIHYKNIMSPA